MSLTVCLPGIALGYQCACLGGWVGYVRYFGMMAQLQMDNVTVFVNIACWLRMHGAI